MMTSTMTKKIVRNCIREILSVNQQIRKDLLVGRKPEVQSKTTT